MKIYKLEIQYLLNMLSDFNIFDSNVNGLESKFENLHSFLNGAKTAMDIVAISETSENDNHSFLQNIKMEGYDEYFPFI